MQKNVREMPAVSLPEDKSEQLQAPTVEQPKMGVVLDMEAIRKAAAEVDAAGAQEKQAQEFEGLVNEAVHISLDHEDSFKTKSAEIAQQHGEKRGRIKQLDDWMTQNNKPVSTGDVAKDLEYQRQLDGYVESVQTELHTLKPEADKLQMEADRYGKAAEALGSVGVLSKIDSYDPARKLAFLTKMINGLNFTSVGIQEKILASMKAGAPEDQIKKLQDQKAALAKLTDKLKPMRQQLVAGQTANADQKLAA